MSKDRAQKLHDEFHDRVNMTVTELEAWEESDNREEYAERKTGGESIDTPLHDAMRLLDTNKPEWSCEDDGFNECEEAEQLLSFTSRMQGVEQGDPMPNTDPGLSKRDASLINWGVDPNPDRRDFVGDR